MNLLHSTDWLYSLSGFAVGMLVGMTGVGGGSLMTPLLILLFGVHAPTAVGTDLLYASATKTAGTLIHGLHDTIEWRIVGLLAAGSLPMTALTLYGLSKLDLHGAAATNLVTFVLGIALLLTAAALLLRSQIVSLYDKYVGALDPRRTALLTVALGGVIGVLVSLSSVGAGAIGVTALILLYPRLPTVRIVGSDIAHAVPLTLLAGFGHWMIRAIDTHMLGLLLIGSLPGIVLGSHIAARVPDIVLRLSLAATLMVVGGRLVF